MFKLLAPSKWRGDKVRPEVNHFRSLNFGHVLSDNDINARLWNGERAGPFRMESALHPGLVRVHVGALPVAAPSSELSKGKKMQFLSEWALARFTELDTAERTMKFLLALGPKVQPEADSIQAIRMELAFASGQPEFSSVRVELGNLARIPVKDTIDSGLAALKGDRLQTGFYQALRWRLAMVKE